MPRYKVESYGNMNRYDECMVEAETEFQAIVKANALRPWRALYIKPILQSPGGEATASDAGGEAPSCNSPKGEDNHNEQTAQDGQKRS